MDDGDKLSLDLDPDPFFKGWIRIWIQPEPFRSDSVLIHLQFWIEWLQFWFQLKISVLILKLSHSSDRSLREWRMTQITMKSIWYDMLSLCGSRNICNPLGFALDSIVVQAQLMTFMVQYVCSSMAQGTFMFWISCLVLLSAVQESYQISFRKICCPFYNVLPHKGKRMHWKRGKAEDIWETDYKK